MSVFVKFLEDGSVLEAPQNYKNITNFNKSVVLMKRHGFVEMIKGYSKATGDIKYVELDKWRYNKAHYTEIPYPNSDYEWSKVEDKWIQKLDVIKHKKLLEIRQSANEYMNALKMNFSNVEMDTLNRQENGLKLLQKDLNSQQYDAIWLKRVAENRGISIEELMRQLEYSINYVGDLMCQVIGYQQKLEDLVYNSSDISEINSIVFDINNK